MACAGDRTGAGARDAAMMALLYGAGLRRSELVALDREDYDAESGALAVRGGKGRKQRLVYVSNGGADAMAAWLGMRGDDAGRAVPAHRQVRSRRHSSIVGAGVALCAATAGEEGGRGSVLAA